MLDLVSASTKRLYEDWEARRRGQLFPARADFDPLALRYIIGNLSLVQVTYQPLRFRYRLHGSNTAVLFGYEMTGKDLEASPREESRRLIRDHFVSVVEERAPAARLRQWEVAGSRILNHEALVLPLAQDGTTIDMLMSAVIPLAKESSSSMSQRRSFDRVDLPAGPG